MSDRPEACAQLIQYALGRPALEDFRAETSAGGEVGQREIDRKFNQRHGAQVVGLLVTRRIGRHVGQDKIRRARQGAEQLFNIRGIIDVTCQKARAVNRIQRQEVYPGDFRSALQERDLDPAPRRAA